jgi:hypothetical protein
MAQIFRHFLRTYGAQGRNRTTDTAIFSRMLYQLSYLGIQAGQPAPAKPGEAAAHTICHRADQAGSVPILGAVRGLNGKPVISAAPAPSPSRRGSLILPHVMPIPAPPPKLRRHGP